MASFPSEYSVIRDYCHWISNIHLQNKPNAITQGVAQYNISPIPNILASIPTDLTYLVCSSKDVGLYADFAALSCLCHQQVRKEKDIYDSLPEATQWYLRHLFILIEFELLFHSLSSLSHWNMKVLWKVIFKNAYSLSVNILFYKGNGKQSLAM